MELFFKDRTEWRKWLENNSISVDELWMIIYKKHTGKWLNSARKAETRTSRIRKIIRFSTENRRPGMM